MTPPDIGTDRPFNTRRAAIGRRIAVVTGVLVLGGSGAALLNPSGSAAAPIGGGASRTWVSGVGDDANPCSRTAPCKTFAGAIAKTAAGGEINVLDPGGFGGVTITKAITITAEDVEAGVLVAGTNAITINAGANDVIVLRGLDIDGTGTGLNGIQFLAGKGLHVESTTINNFTRAGIDFAPSGTSSLFVDDLVVRDNLVSPDGVGIYVHPSGSGKAKAVVNDAQLVDNLVGLRAAAASAVTLSNSIVDGCTLGVHTTSTTKQAEVNLASTSVTHCTTAGVYAQGGFGILTLSDAHLAGNTLGIKVATGGRVQSFGNNTNGDGGAPTKTFSLQ